MIQFIARIALRLGSPACQSCATEIPRTDCWHLLEITSTPSITSPVGTVERRRLSSFRGLEVVPDIWKNWLHTAFMLPKECSALLN